MPRATRTEHEHTVPCPCGEGTITTRWVDHHAIITGDPFWSDPPYVEDGPTDACDSCGNDDPTASPRPR